MSNASVEVQGASRRKFIPMAIVAIMAVLVGVAIAFAAIANGYEGGSYNPVLKPVSVEKQLEPGTESSGDTLFDFELTVSPEYVNDKLNQIDEGDSRVESVTGIVYNVAYDNAGNSTLTPAAVDAGSASEAATINGMTAVTDATDDYGNPVLGMVTLGIKDHTVRFSLKAGQRILFEDMPFAHDDAYDEHGNKKDSNFIVKELIGYDSAAAKVGYDFSGVEVRPDASKGTIEGTGTTAKTAYDEYKEYLYDEQGNCIYAYYDAYENVVADPECGKDDYEYVNVWFDANIKRMDAEPTGPDYNSDNYKYVYVNTEAVKYGIGNTDVDWYFNINQNGGYVYYDFDGNQVNNASGDEIGCYGYVVDNKLIAVNPRIKVYHDKYGNEVVPKWAKYDHAYTTHATEVVFSNKKVLDPRPLKVTKSVEKSADDAKDDPNAVFNFELIASPGYGKDVSYKDRKVSGVITNADSSVPPSLPMDYTFDENHAITFSLRAGESIEFADMPFATDDEKGTYIIKELSYEVKEGTEEQPAASYKFGTVSADKGTCTVTKDGDVHHDSNALGTATGTLGANGLTSVTVTNRQVTPPSQETPVDGNAKVTISKMLEGADDPDATFDFEMIISPEWATPEHYIGTNTEPVSITGTVYNKSDGKEIGSKTYNVVQNRVTGIELKAGQYITFADVPYKHVEGEPGAVIVNELLEGVVAKSYSLQGYTVDTGKDLGFGQATQDTIVNTDNTSVSSLLAPSGATDKTATGVYGELVLDESGNGEFGVTFTNAPAGSKLTVTKNLEGFDFGKYDEANVAFNVYRFDTEADCVAFVRNGNAQNATWKGTLAMHLTANGVQSTELTGLDEGYYAIEELSATNMKVVDIARKHVHVTAGVGGEFTVSFSNTFDDQNTYENAIVNSYKKVIDKDGKITWQRYKDGEPVTD